MQERAAPLAAFLPGILDRLSPLEDELDDADRKSPRIGGPRVGETCARVSDIHGVVQPAHLRLKGRRRCRVG